MPCKTNHKIKIDVKDYLEPFECEIGNVNYSKICKDIADYSGLKSRTILSGNIYVNKISARQKEYIDGFFMGLINFNEYSIDKN